MPIKKDFSFISNMETTSAGIIISIKKSLNTISYIDVLEVNVFDVYSEKLSSSDKKSLGIEVIMQPNEKTLNDKEISDILNLIIENVEKDTNSILRT